jgi:hypothetical protein
MTINLIDVSKNMNKLHINEWMVTKKLATWGKSAYIPKNITFKHYQECVRKKHNNLRSYNNKLKALNLYKD